VLCERSPLISRVVDGVGCLSEGEWTACYPDEVEGWAYYRACEEEPPAGVRVGAVEVRDGRGLLAAAPLFQLSYRLDTPLQGPLRPLADRVAACFPRLVEWRLLGVGSPFADRCHVALRPGLGPGERAPALRELVSAVEAQAKRAGVALIAYKDLVGQEHKHLADVLGSVGYSEIRSLPVAALDVPATGPEQYLRTLSAATRKDVRRKLKSTLQITVERRTGIDHMVHRIAQLYETTRENSAVRYGDFEELPGDYFGRVSRALGQRALFVTYRIGDELAGFNLLLLEPDRAIDKFLGMAYPVAREHNLYIVSWMENVRFCIETGRRVLQSGQTAYGSKVRLGSRLIPASNFAKHRNPLLNRAIALAAPLLAYDRWDSDLRKLRNSGRLS
jgi:class 3 adenylate cyclase